MKPTTVILVLTILFYGCSHPKYDYKLENTILNCFYEHHQNEHNDIKTSIIQIEDALIKNGILRDHSGESYIQAITRIKENNYLPIDNPKLLADISSIEFIPSSVSCQDSTYLSMIDSSSLYNSKLKYVIGIFDSIQKKGTITPTLVAEEILEVYDAEDFENEYYKTLGLVTISTLIRINDYKSGINTKLSPLPKEHTYTADESDVLVVIADGNNVIIVNNEQVELPGLRYLVKTFISEKASESEIELPMIGRQMISNAVISFQNKRGTSYSFYIDVQKEIIQAYSELRDERSLHFFNSTFENLNEQEQNVIKELVPQKIVEGEPTY